MKRRIAITGASGQLGLALASRFGSQAISFKRKELDVTDFSALSQALTRERPDVLVNCAAFTAVDLAESRVTECMAINAVAVENLSGVCSALGIRLVQISTDYIFGGDKKSRIPYVESDLPNPLSVYGHSKLQGEQQASKCAQHLIVRTCGLYGVPQARSFLNSILSRARENKPLRIVADQYCSPSFVEDVARGIAYLVDNEAAGIFHVVNSGVVSWFEFAQSALESAKIHTEVIPITSDDYAAEATRPAFSALGTDKYIEAGGPILGHWSEPD